MNTNRALATCNTHLVQPQSRQCGLRMAADGLAFACCLSRHTPGLFQNSRDFLRFPTTTTKYEAKSRQWTPLAVDAVSIRLIKTQQKRFVGVCLSYANSAMNPFVYAIVGDSFRDCIRQTFCRTKRQRRLAAGTRRACPKRAFPVHSRVSTRQLSRVSRTRSTGSTTVQLYVTVSNSTEVQMTRITSREAESAV
ncbi:receptor [Branchiostoma belcheri]|nr:receptor [Branchiostoma belcheri]